MKCCIFDATGTTLAHFFTGRASRAAYVLVLIVLICLGMSTAGLVIAASARSSNEPQLLAAYLLSQGPYLSTYPFLAFYGLALYNMGGTIGHLFNVDKAEDALLARRKAKAEAAASASPDAVSA